MADQKKAGMISGMDPLAVLTGDELLEVSQLGVDGVWKTFSILVNKIRTNQGLSAYEIAVKNGFQGTEAEWLETLNGKSAFQLAVELGFPGTEDEWLDSLVGPSAYAVAVAGGFQGTQEQWLNSLKGQSAYQLAVAGGFVGTEAQWLTSLKGKSAYQIAKDLDPTIGTEAEWLVTLVGKSAYQVALDNGFVGTQAAWLASLKGQSAYQAWVAQGGVGDEAAFIASLKGANGLSAYEIYKAQPGNANKTEAEFIASLKGTNGTDGTDGEDGVDGKSAYQLAVEAGFVGDQAAWLASLKGADGTNGTNGTNGTDGDSAYQIWESQPGNVGKSEAEFLAAMKGEEGDSAYEVAVAGGFVGNQAAWLASLKGSDGLSAFQTWLAQPGNAGKTEADFLKSLEGKSAYETYKALPGNSNKTEAEFIASLKGATGEDGASAYTVWLNAGNTGTVQQYLDSLKGQDGTNGANGTNGQSINVIATISQEDFDLIVAEGLSKVADAYVVDTFIYIFNGTDWVKSNSIQGPEGKGLNYLGTWPTGTPLPAASDVSYKAGDTYIWGATAGTISLWTLVEQPSRAWVDIGVPGPQGKSAYQSWLDAGNVGTELQFVASLKGKDAFQTWLAIPGNAGKSEQDFIDDITGEQGPEGKSAFQVWQAIPGNEGKTQADFLVAITGPQGVQGQPAVAFVIAGQLASVDELPAEGVATEAYYVGSDLYVWIDSLSRYENLGSLNGESAYQLWLVQPGNAGKSEQDFLNSLIGKSAYQIAVEDGFVGDEAAWLISLHGTNGTNGTDGKNLQVEGTKANSTEIQAIVTPADQEAWVALDTGHLWIYNGTAWVDAGPFRGEDGVDGLDGKSAFELWKAIPGNENKTETEFFDSLKGEDGTDGTNGTNGTNGRNVEVKGALANLAAIQALPTPAQQDAYTAQDTNTLYMYINTTWTNLGKFQGAKGDPGETGGVGPAGQGINIVGEVATVAELSTFLPGNVGDAVFVLETHKLYQINDAGVFGPGISIQGPQGEEGQQGIQGEIGPGIQIMGSYATSGDLIAAHPTGTAGDAYLVGPDLYLYGVNPTGGATEWYNAGPFRGIQGPIGNDGPRGLRGLTGLTGDRGSLWLMLPDGQDEPTSANGRQGDWAVNEAHVLFYKSDATTWLNMGPLVAGDVNSPALGLGKVVREGTAWVKLPVDAVPSPSNGVQYVMKGNASGGTDWAVLSVPAAGVEEVPASTTVPKGRTSAGWVSVIALPTGQDATKRYEWLNGAWALSAVQAASPATLNKPLCYRQLATGLGEWVTPTFDSYSLLQDSAARTASFTPDFTQQQTFRINAANDVTVTLGQFTAGRTLMAVFVMEGSANKLKMATAGGAQIGLNGGTALADIEYGATQTVITAFWNGFGTWIVSKGPSY